MGAGLHQPDVDEAAGGAYEKSRDKAKADDWRKRLLDWKIPTVEEVLVAFAYRAQQQGAVG
ncbi:MAG TPA: hypothetical protein VGJ33_19750 [Candidatus Angelobacter sp.]